MSSFDKILADYGNQEPVTVEVSWDAVVIVHPVTVSMFVDANSEGDEKPIYQIMATAVEVDGEFWSASQWASLPKRAMKDVSAIYEAYRSLNGSDEDEELEKN